MSPDPALSLAELETFDPTAPVRARERRFCCPRPGCDGKPKDAEHRSLAANVETGAWQCHRCQEKGLLLEWREKHPRANRREWERSSLRRTFAVPAAPVVPAVDEEGLVRRLQGLTDLRGTAGESYVQSRGIPLDLASTAQVRFSPSWWGRPAVLFPIRDPAGKLVATQGRYVDGRTDLKTRTAGPAGAGVFATPDALRAELVAITEAPLDALSLWVCCGIPAIATLGCNLPSWLPRVLAFKRVLVGTDADAAGDEAFAKWAPHLGSLGAKVDRLRPVEHKDWNEWLQKDPEGLRAFLRGVVPAVALSEPVAPAAPDPEAPWAREAEAEALITETLHRVGERLLETPRDLSTPEFDAVEKAMNDAFFVRNMDTLRAACALFVSMVAGPDPAEAGPQPALALLPSDADGGTEATATEAADEWWKGEAPPDLARGTLGAGAEWDPGPAGGASSMSPWS